MVFQCFCYVGHVMLDEKINKKSIKKPIKVKMQVGMDFGWLLDRFLVDFGAMLGGKLGSSWHYNPTKWDTKTMSTNHQKSRDARVPRGSVGRLFGSWLDFWWILGPSWEVSCAQVGTKIQENAIPRRCQKIIKNLKPQ